MKVTPMKRTPLLKYAIQASNETGGNCTTALVKKYLIAASTNTRLLEHHFVMTV
jgi:hypothetical protein